MFERAKANCDGIVELLENIKVNGCEGVVLGSEVYSQYEIGDTVECELVTYYYDDSSIENKLEYNK